jgi:hypothetical protein
MATNDFPYVFPYSNAEARRLNRLPMCEKATKQTSPAKTPLSRQLSGLRRIAAQADCAEGVIAEYGFKRYSGFWQIPSASPKRWLFS